MTPLTALVVDDGPDLTASLCDLLGAPASPQFLNQPDVLLLENVVSKPFAPDEMLSQILSTPSGSK